MAHAWVFVLAPMACYLLGIWIGYEHGKERGFEDCRQKWEAQIWENIDRIVKR